MFRLDLSPTFKAKVEFSIIGADGAGQQHEFMAEFVRLSIDDAEALAKQSTAEQWSDRRLAAHLVRGWEGVADRHGNAIPFTPDGQGLVLNVQGVPTAMLRAYRRANQGADLGN